MTVNKTLYVGPELVDCVGVAPMECMQVREDPNEPYSLFYNQIDGFEFEPGYEYELVVQVDEAENPPADASSLKYTLVEEVSRTPVATESAEAAGALMLEGTRWVLVSYLNADGETTAALENVEATAEFSEGQVGGNASCNRYFGGYTVDGSALTFGQLGSTMMACPPPVSDQETQFMANLQATATYTIEGDQLLLANADGETVLTFAASEPISLTGSAWVVTGHNNGREAVVSTLADTTMTANFGEDGSLTGSAGCNNYMTTYEIDGESMTIQPPASTRKLCPGEGVMDQEAEFLQALTTVATYRIDGNTMELRTADGALAVSLVAESTQ